MKVNYVAPINSTGYGYAGVNFLKGMIDAGHDVMLWPTSQDEIAEQYKDYCAKASSYQYHKFDPYAPALRLWHQFDMSLFPGAGPKFGMTFFEVGLKLHELTHLNYLDKVIVPCQGLKDMAQEAGVVTDIDVVPLGVDTDIFHPGVPDLRTGLNIQEDEVVFLNIGKWEIRKGHDILLDAFNKAFPGNERVKLIMACKNPCLTDEENFPWEQYYGGNADKRVIVATSRMRNQHEVAKLIATADCGVFPSKAEAWNFEGLECLAMQKQLIITDYLGHREYANNDNAYLIPVTEFEAPYDGRWFYGEGKWAKLNETSIDALIAHMRTVYKNGRETNKCEVIHTWSYATNKLMTTLKSEN